MLSDDMDLKQTLELMDLWIANDTCEVLSCLAAEMYMKQYFYEVGEEDQKRFFKTNIANTFAFRITEAMIERGVVKIAQQIHTEIKKASGFPIEVTHRWDLVNHRDYLSHYGEVEFRNTDLQVFFDNKRQYSDPKAIIIWQARKSIMDKLTELKSDKPKKYPLYLTVLNGMPEVIDCAIQYSLNDNVPRAPLAELNANLIDYFRKYQDAIASAPLFEPEQKN